MTAQEKAKELVDKFDKPTRYWDQAEGWQSDLSSAKLAAIIAIDEILAIAKYLDTYTMETLWREEPDYNSNESYWQSVKEEINKL